MGIYSGIELGIGVESLLCKPLKRPQRPSRTSTGAQPGATPSTGAQDDPTGRSNGPAGEQRPQRSVKRRRTAQRRSNPPRERSSGAPIGQAGQRTVKRRSGAQRRNKRPSDRSSSPANGQTTQGPVNGRQIRSTGPATGQPPQEASCAA